MLPFFNQFDMEVFDVQERDIHGGSVRVFVSRKGQHPISPSVEEMVRKEVSEQLYSPQLLEDFALRVEENRRELSWLLHSLKQKGHRLVG